MRKILAIGAHFDDVELGVGGAMAKLSQGGADVYKLTLTNNVTKFNQLAIDVDFETSFEESLKACNVLGIKQIEPTAYAECTNLEFNPQVMQDVERIVFDLKIDTVFCHFFSDMQQDHVNASKISYVAARYCKNIFFYQSNRYVFPESFYPRTFVDITQQIDIKMKALNCYTGAHDRFSQLFAQTKLQNQVWGYQSKLGSDGRFAEGLVVHKQVL